MSFKGSCTLGTLGLVSYKHSNRLNASGPNPVAVPSQCSRKVDMQQKSRQDTRKGKYLMVSVRLGRMASTMVGDRQVRVSLLSILYCASLIRSCSRCSSTYNTRSIQCIVQWHILYKVVVQHFCSLCMCGVALLGQMVTMLQQL